MADSSCTIFGEMAAGDAVALSHLADGDRLRTPSQAAQYISTRKVKSVHWVSLMELAASQEKYAYVFEFYSIKYAITVHLYKDIPHERPHVAC